MERRRIAIVGAGAIGGWLAARLAQAQARVCVVARGHTLEAIKRNGLSLTENGKTIVARVRASDVPAELGPQDLVILAVKGHALAPAAPAVAQLLGAETAVLPAMNGIGWWFAHGLGGELDGMAIRAVDPDGAIARAIPPERVIGCVVHASSSAPEPATIVHTHGNRLIVGEPNGEKSARLAGVAGMLRAAGFEVTVSPRIQQDVWYKLWGNMTMNPISALTGATGDLILDDALVRQFILAVMAEAKAVGARIGCPIAESGEDRMAVTDKLGCFKTSMLQDAEAGRPLEIDALLAAPREIAGKAGVATPHLDALHGLIRLFETVRRKGR